MAKPQQRHQEQPMAQILPFVASTRRRSRICGERSTAISHTPCSKRLPARLINKLQRLVLERPDAVEAVERLIDKVLAYKRPHP